MAAFTTWPQRLYALTPSTEQMAQHWLPHVEHGVSILAVQQTAGHGRQGRAWHSSAGNLTASLWGKNLPSAPAFWPFFWAVVVHQVLADALPPHAPLYIKWPNDILLGNAKVAGILLTQTQTALGMGLGINLRHAPLPHTAVLPIALTPYALWQGILQQAQRMYTPYWQQPQRLHAQWLQRALPLGTRLQVRHNDAFIVGDFAGLHPHGALVLNLPQGEQRLFYAADTVELEAP